MSSPRAFYSEWDKKTAAWLRELIKRGLIPDGDVDERSITELKGSDLDGYGQHHFFAGIAGWPLALRWAGWPDDASIWSGSAPCQPYSLGGSLKGTEDHRDLWPDYFRLIRQHHPDFLIGEQVESAIAFGWLDRLCDDLESEDYAIGSAVLPACSVGANHIRDRLFWVAHTSGARRPRLVPSANPGPAGQGWLRSAEDLQTLVNAPFERTDRWPQPLLRAVDDGLSSRVVGCHGAGNAVVPQVAAAFITSYLETLNAKD